MSPEEWMPSMGPARESMGGVQISPMVHWLGAEPSARLLEPAKGGAFTRPELSFRLPLAEPRTGRYVKFAWCSPNFWNDSPSALATSPGPG